MNSTKCINFRTSDPLCLCASPCKLNCILKREHPDLTPGQGEARARVTGWCPTVTVMRPTVTVRCLDTSNPALWQSTPSPWCRVTRMTIVLSSLASIFLSHYMALNVFQGPPAQSQPSECGRQHTLISVHAQTAAWQQSNGNSEAKTSDKCGEWRD